MLQNHKKYLHSRVVGAVEAVEVLMGFHQSQMTRQCLFIPTELMPSQRMLRPKHMLQMLPEDSDDVYATNKFDAYLRRP